MTQGEVWVNRVGTYGIASARYWWGRMAAMILIRFFYYVLSASGDQDALLFADDWLATASCQTELFDIQVVLFIWVSLGVPWKWLPG